MPITNQKEEIDSRILRIIDLEDVFDLDYDTYLTLLKEAMVKGRMSKKTIPTEEVMLLTDEYKRVKSKKDKGRFQVKKKNITATSFNVGNVKAKVSSTKALPGTAIGISPLTKSLEGNITALSSSIVSISETLKQQKKISDSVSAYEKRKAEQEKRSLTENRLEKRFEGLKKVAEKIIAPVKSLLDKILQFFTTVILGRIVYKLVEWLGDEKNASKVKSIIRFVKDWWPALLGSYILFGTSFGKFIRGTVSLIGRFIFQIGKVAIPKLLGLIRANPLIAAGVVTGLATGGAEMWRQKEENRLINKEARKRNVSPEVVKEEKVKSDSGFLGLLGQGFSKIGPLGYAGGGLASGYVSGEKGVDKVPAMLSDGEFVMSVGAVEKYGVDTLEAMNAAGGGTNKPKMINGKTYAAGGGSIGSERYSLMPGFSGESSQSDVYLIRAINELIKVLRNKFPDRGPSGSSSDSYPPSASGLPQKLSNIAEEIASRGSQLYQGASSIANRGISAASSIANRGVDLARRSFGIAAEKAKPLMEKAKSTIQSLPATMDYGSLYLRSQFGGLGGSITEADLSKQTQSEYARAFAIAKAKASGRRASVESQVRYYQGLLKASNLTASQKAEFEKQLKVNQSRLEKYKKGQIDVQYEDFVDKNGRLSAAARAAQKTLGAVWATSTRDGGIQIEKEPYDFPIVNDPWGLINWPNMNKKQRDEWLKKQPLNSPHRRQLEQNPNAWGKQKIAEALYSLNPFATPVETDVKIGGKPRAKGIIDALINAVDNPLMSMSRGLAMNLLKGRERNVVTGEAEKGSFWDKLFPKKGPPLPKPGQRSGAVTMYSKPRKNTGQPYQSRFSRPRNAGVRPVRPPAKPRPTVVSRPTYRGGGRGSGSRPTSQRPPNFSATTRGSRPKANTLGIPNQASYR